MKIRRDVFHGLGDPTRRAILGLIALQALTPNMIADHFDCSRQAVSKHIQILIECRLVKQEWVGREIYYQVDAAKMKEAADWMEPFRILWEGRHKKLDTLLHQLKNKK